MGAVRAVLLSTLCYAVWLDLAGVVQVQLSGALSVCLARLKPRLHGGRAFSLMNLGHVREVTSHAMFC